MQERAANRIAAGILALMLLVGVIASLTGQRSSSSASSGTDYAAITSCERYVKDRLLAPSTAKLSGWSDSTTSTATDGTTTVRGYVDAQNVYGAMLRTHYTCVLGPSSTLTRPLLSLTGL